jgi:nitric oxide reductase NorE protein
MTDAEPGAAAVQIDAPPDAGDGDQQEKHLQGDSSMWVFILGDLVIFGIYFLVYMVQRSQERSLFLESQQHLSQNIGVINTLVLLTSSLFVARGVQAARARDHRRAMRLTLYGGACGVLFILIKIYEWSTEIGQGFTLPTNDFFMYYYMLTGVHLFHVSMGLVVVGIVVRELRNPHLRRISMVETGAVYWHMVDLLWIVAFALLYVLR